ncbi:MAG: PASTA domain-containing protein [Coriobacteriia bacterium]|nr:PASTA domain-containing protein [Coriobacteriia bacterium]
MTDRPRRKRLVAVWLLPSLAAIVLVISGGALLVRANYVSALISTPDVTGRPDSTARENLSLSGLSYEVSGRQFSADVPEGSVLSQLPAAGERVERGTVVRVVLSAGTESLVMPDLIGLPLQAARDRLRDLGLGSSVQDVVSEAEAGTVLASFPAAGADVRTGTSVRLSVATGGDVVDSLLPYDLHDVIVALDPVGVEGDTQDVSMDIARRLRSLLEASGATVTMSRSSTEGVVPDAVRASAIASPAPDVAVGIALSSTQKPGITAIVLRSLESSTTERSLALGKEFTASVRLPGQSVNAYQSDNDAVLGKLLAPGMRVYVGDPDDPDDAIRFQDPDWADAVSRALYKSIGDLWAPR